jgi:MSHA biogenesis protein MshJ
MSLSASFMNLSTRFNAISLRERAMIFGAVLAVLILAWDTLLMQPLDKRKEALTNEMQEVQSSMAQLTSSLTADGGDPVMKAFAQQQSLQQSLAAADEQLQTMAAGLIAPPRMVAALRDMLERQQGLRLVELKNLPARALVPPIDAQQPEHGPFIHPVEMTIEGDYLTLLRYLEAIESLPWRFYWQVLELQTIEYPHNRVRLRLNTLSMDAEWLGV